MSAAGTSIAPTPMTFRDVHFWVKRPQHLQSVIQVLLHPSLPLHHYIAIDMYHPRLFRVAMRRQDWPVVHWFARPEVKVWFRSHGMEPLYTSTSETPSKNPQHSWVA
jgi:hypothetical protein